MKVIVKERNYAPMEPGSVGAWYFLSDSAVSNTGKPFYVPSEYGASEVCVAPAVKFNRLGKSIARRFSHRYYSEMAPALHFRMPDLALKLREEGCSEDPSRNFDRSLFVGDFLPINENEEFLLKKNGEQVSELKIGHLYEPIDEIVEEVSRLNTIKMGDLLLPALSCPVEVKPGDVLEVFRNGVPAFKVKVK